MVHFCGDPSLTFPSLLLLVCDDSVAQYVKDLKLKLLSAEDQIAGRMDAAEVQLGTAVETGLIDNETLAYFMARSQLFMVKIGVDPEKLRFRQHKSNEMAHYAKDCWDAEIWLHSHVSLMRIRSACRWIGWMFCFSS